MTAVRQAGGGVAGADEVPAEPTVCAQRRVTARIAAAELPRQ